MNWRQTENAMLGLPIWWVRYERGVLRIDFGSPYLRIKEPATNTNLGDSLTGKLRRRRIANPTGDFHLFADNCDWEVRAFDLYCNKNTTDQSNIALCLSSLSGQKFIDVHFSTRHLECIFHFDLGGTLSLRSVEQSSEKESAVKKADLWTIFFKDGTYISYDEDGRFVYNGGS